MDNEQNKDPNKQQQQDGGDPNKQDPNKSPNDDYKNDPNLDENGNPIEKQTDEKKEIQSEKKDDSTKEEKNEPVKFDSDQAKQVESFLTDAGLTAKDVAQELFDNGGNVTPETLKKLVDKHGDAVANLLVGQLQNLHEGSKNKVREQDQAIYKQVEEAFSGVTEQSGEESWKELSAWAKDNIPNDERKEFNALVKQGGKAAKLAVADLINQFNESQTNKEFQDADLLDGDSTTDDVGFQPISKIEYNKQLDKLLNSGHDYNSSIEIKQLNARRLKSLKRNVA